MLEQKIDDLKLRAISIKNEVWEKIKKYPNFNQLKVMGCRIVNRPCKLASALAE